MKVTFRAYKDVLKRLGFKMHEFTTDVHGNEQKGHSFSHPGGCVLYVPRMRLRDQMADIQLKAAEKMIESFGIKENWTFVEHIYQRKLSDLRRRLREAKGHFGSIPGL